ncbi:hypothetical protein PENSPDRAFT_688762 [Peniophora sp. CONT]|nr:hypothetical protein PENSPDRAFT_688762 [Peniophora sp. CONT]
MASSIGRYAPELVASLALSSLSVHLHNARTAAADDIARLGARTSILESLAVRLRAGERVPELEIGQLRRLALEAEQQHDRGAFEVGSTVGWWEAIFGRKTTEEERAARDAHEERDFDALRAALEKDEKASRA